MLICDAARESGVTKKAIAYYIGQGLLTPSVRENGYRDFSEEQVECLKRISVLRRLGLGTEEIRSVLSDTTGETFKGLSVRRELRIRKEEKKKELLEQLGLGRPYQEIDRELKSLEESLSIAERLFDAFPGFYGRWLCLHFAGFLGSPIETEEQRLAYQEIMEFLDNLPDIELPEELQEYIEETAGQLSAEQIGTIIEKQRRAFEDPELFLSENREFIAFYLELKQTDEYQSSPAIQLEKFLKELNESTGYYKVFIPAMRRLCPSYAEYGRQIEAADQIFLARYPKQRV